MSRGHQRRCSDPSASIDTWLRAGGGGVRAREPQPRSRHCTVLYCTVLHCTVLCRSRHPSETDCLDKWLTTAPEIAAGDLRDTLDDGTTNPVWTMRGYTQVHQLSWQT